MAVQVEKVLYEQLFDLQTDRSDLYRDLWYAARHYGTSAYFGLVDQCLNGYGKARNLQHMHDLVHYPINLAKPMEE